MPGGNVRLVRYKNEDGVARWGIVQGDAVKEIHCEDSVEELHNQIRQGKIETRATLPVKSIRLLPPTSLCAAVYCAGLNYRDHAREVKMPLPKSPIFFTKPSSSLCGACDDIVYPSVVKLLDYEVELAVVVGRKIGKDDVVDNGNLGDFILGITILNDISARDIQLAGGQWFLGKSFRTFAPIGPIVQTLDEEVVKQLYSLRLELSVVDAHGENPHKKSQSGTTSEMVFPIHKLLEVLKMRLDLHAGDIIATGTPHGVALRSPSRLKTRFAEIFGVPPAKRIASFLEHERKTNPRYLHVGDTVIARIFSEDGTIDLGEQRCRVVHDEGVGR